MPEGATLQRYLLDGFRWLAFPWSNRSGGALVDNMGLGKTVQSLTDGAQIATSCSYVQKFVSQNPEYQCLVA